MVNNVFRQRELPLITRSQDAMKTAIAQLERQAPTAEVRHALKSLKTLTQMTTAGRTMLDTLFATGKASANALRRFGMG
jgi:hypothetical protein